MAFEQLVAEAAMKKKEESKKDKGKAKGKAGNGSSEEVGETSQTSEKNP